MCSATAAPRRQSAWRKSISPTMLQPGRKTKATATMAPQIGGGEEYLGPPTKTRSTAVPATRSHHCRACLTHLAHEIFRIHHHLELCRLASCPMGGEGAAVS